MTISAHIGRVKAAHDLIEVDLSCGHIEITFLGVNGNEEFRRRLTVEQSRDLAAVLQKAAGRLEEHEAGRHREQP